MLEDSLRGFTAGVHEAVEMYSALIDSIEAIAVKLGLLRRSNGGTLSRGGKPWFDRRCLELKRGLRVALRNCRRSAFDPPLLAIYLETKSDYRRELIRARQSYYSELRRSIAHPDSPSLFWKAVRSLTAADGQRDANCALSMEAVYDHLSAVFSCHGQPQPFVPRPLLVFVPILDTDFSLAELDVILAGLKLRKSPGPDGLSNEFYKYLSFQNKLFLLDLLNRFFLEGPPPCWSTSRMFMMFKKGNPSLPESYRGISLLNSLTKVFTSLLAGRIAAWADAIGLLPESQAGFRRGRSCVDNLFILSSVIGSRLRLKGGKLYSFFVDFRQAFDRVHHGCLFEKLHSFGLSAKVINVLGLFYNEASTVVKINGNYSESIHIYNGVLQGDSLSPLLFALYISDLENFMRLDGFNGVDLDNRGNNVIGILYADDLVLLSDREAGLQIGMNALAKYCRMNFLEVNPAKSKVVVFRRGGVLRRGIRFVLGDVRIEIVSQYNYLGVVFSSSGCFAEASEHLVAKADFAAVGIRSLLVQSDCDSQVSRSLLFKSAVQSVLLYGAEVWALRYENIVERVQLRFVKMLYGLPRSTPNYVIRLEFGLSALIVDILDRALRWIVRLEGMEEDRLPRICYLRQLELLEHASVNFNWLKQIEGLFTRAGCGDQWEVIREGRLSLCSVTVLDDLRSVLAQEDRARATSSNFCPLYRVFLGSEALQMSAEPMPLRLSRLWHQVRVQNARYNRIYWNGFTHTFDASAICQLCNYKGPDSLEHFILDCTVLQDFRRKFGMYRIMGSGVDSGVCSLSGLAACTSSADAYLFLRFLRAILGARRFVLSV